MPDLFYGTSGPQSAQVMVVAESWGREEELAKQPLVGASGHELNAMLAEAGYNRNDFFVTNVIGARPGNNEAWRFFTTPKDSTRSFRGLHPTPFVMDEVNRLWSQIASVNPKLVIAIGNYALWALTEHAGYSTAKDKTTNKSSGVRQPNGIMSWRGSQTYVPSGKLPVLPIIHPAAILRQWELRSPTVHDLFVRIPLALTDKWSEPQRTFITPTNQNEFDLILDFFTHLLLRVDVGGPVDVVIDIETHRPLMICIGIAISPSFAISIPLVKILPDGTFDSFWTIEQEARLISLMRWLLSNPAVRIIGQNLIYDLQYLEAEYGGPIKIHFDTMLAQHLLFPGTPKGLDYLSSLYCEHHKYWKDDGKDWYVDQDLKRQLLYNCEDCVRTFECSQSLRMLLVGMHMSHLWPEELEKHELAMRMMRRGSNVDKKLRSKMRFELMTQQTEIERWLLHAIPQEFVPRGKSDKFWFSSPQQTKFVLYELLGLPAQSSRFTGEDTTGKEALAALKEKFPRLKNLFDHLSARRSLAVFQNNFINKSLEYDGRMRTQFNPGGTETFRWSSSENAFGRGTNMQNIPSGNED